MVNFRLSNGLEVVLEENHAAPVVAFQAWVKVGSADEPPPLAGAAHLAEHMFFKGTKRRGVGQIAQEVEGAGGEINAWTSYDETAYHLVLASRFFDTGLDILADALQNSAFDPDELERERKVVLEEVKQGLDDPDRMAAQGLFEAAFDAHPYGRPIIGSAQTVTDLTRQQLTDFVHQRYVASNITLVVVGDIDTATARAAIEAAFGSMPAGRPLDARPPQPEQAGARVRVLARDVKECQLLLGYQGPGVGHEDVPALDLLAVVLGQGESSRLNLQVVRQRQLVTSASAYTFAARDPGLFVVGASLPPRRPERALDAVLGEISRLRREEVTVEELAKCRTILESERIFDKETVQGYARKLGFFATIAGDVGFEERYFQRLGQVSPADLRAMANRYLDPARLTLFAQLPEPRAERQEASARELESRLRAVVARSSARDSKASRQKAGPGVGSPSRGTARTAARRDPVVTRQLDSGIRLLVLPDPSVAIVAVRATWTGGLRFETPEQAGVSNMIAALMTRGTRTRDAEAIMQKVEGMAGSLSGYSGRNSLGLAAEFLSRHFVDGLGLVADCLSRPVFPDEEVARERRIVLEDIRAQDDNLTHVVFRAFHEEIWKGHPYRLDPLGTPASLGKLDRSRLQRHFRQHYTPEGLTLAVVGDVKADDVIRQLDELLPARAGKAARRPARARKPPPARRSVGPQKVERFLQREQAHVVVGFPGVTLDHPDRFALELLAQVLSGQGGRLFVEIREKRALAYRVSAFSIEGIDPGYFAIYVGTSVDKLDEVLTSVRRELALLRDEGVPGDELERAQRYLIGTHAIGLQRKSAIAAALAFHEAYGQGWRTYRQYAERIGRVRVADLRRVAQKYLVAQREVVAVVRPQDVVLPARGGGRRRSSSPAAALNRTPRAPR
jgi:zinc protease